MPSFVVFPTHLYEDSLVTRENWENIYIVEHPLFFYDAKDRPYRTHKLKIAYLRACMKAYQDYLVNDRKLSNVQYIEYSQATQKKFIGHIHCYDPLDTVLETRLKKSYPNITIHTDLPNFVADTKDVLSYSKRTSYSHKTFYDFMKQKSGILKNVKNYDTMNRDRLPASIEIPSILNFGNSYQDEAIKYVNGHPQFKKHVGTCDRDILSKYPCTFKDAKANLQHFLKMKLSNFGAYEDAIHTQHVYVFHSNISSQLNVGLLTPQQVVDAILHYKPYVAMNNIEGYIRQVIGWRDYMRFVYKVVDVSANQWSATRSLNWDVWYGKKESPIEPLTQEIKKCIEHGYSHHIVRLMVFLNIMVLCEVNPHDICQWFSECCAMDAYPWVMYSNIYAMGWYDARFMKKPYLSTSRYLLNMSNYKRGTWCLFWDALFYAFLHQHKNQFVGSSKIYWRNLTYFEKKDNAARMDILRTAESVKKSLTLS